MLIGSLLEAGSRLPRGHLGASSGRLLSFLGASLGFLGASWGPFLGTPGGLLGLPGGFRGERLGLSVRVPPLGTV